METHIKMTVDELLQCVLSGLTQMKCIPYEPTTEWRISMNGNDKDGFEVRVSRKKDVDTSAKEAIIRTAR